MGWFKNFIDGLDSNSKSQEKVEALKEKLEEEERKKLEEQKRKEEEEANKYGSVKVEAIGNYSFDLINTIETVNGVELSLKDIEFTYDIKAYVNDDIKPIPVSGKITYDVYTHMEYQYKVLRMWNHPRDIEAEHEERAYERLLELLDEGNDVVMNGISKEVMCKVREYLRNNKLDEMKKLLRENNELDININFEMKVDKKYLNN